MPTKSVRETNKFSREFKRTIRRGKDPEKMFEVVTLRSTGQSLPQRMHPHKLSGEYAGLWECHIEPDRLLIYEELPDEILLIRTGSHADLFR